MVYLSWNISCHGNRVIESDQWKQSNRQFTPPPLLLNVLCISHLSLSFLWSHMLVLCLSILMSRQKWWFSLQCFNIYLSVNKQCGFLCHSSCWLCPHRCGPTFVLVHGRNSVNPFDPNRRLRWVRVIMVPFSDQLIPSYYVMSKTET